MSHTDERERESSQSELRKIHLFYINDPIISPTHHHHHHHAHYILAHSDDSSFPRRLLCDTRGRSPVPCWELLPTWINSTLALSYLRCDFHCGLYFDGDVRCGMPCLDTTVQCGCGYGSVCMRGCNQLITPTPYLPLPEHKTNKTQNTQGADSLYWSVNVPCGLLS